MTSEYGWKEEAEAEKNHDSSMVTSQDARGTKEKY